MTPLDRLLHLLAGSGLTFKEVVELLSDIRRLNPLDVGERVESIRATSHQLTGKFNAQKTTLEESDRRIAWLTQGALAKLDSKKTTSSSALENAARQLRDENKRVVFFSHSRDAWQDVATRVERLLKDEAGLSTHQAYQALAHSLVTEGVLSARDLPPLPNKKGLHYWVSRLDEHVPAKVVLQHATRIRNSAVHEPKKPWELSSGPKER